MNIDSHIDHPRYTTVETDSDVLELPTLAKEYSVEIERFGNKQFDIGVLYLRIRPGGLKTYDLRFLGSNYSGVRTLTIGVQNHLSLKEASLLAKRACDRAETFGSPEKRQKLPRNTPCKEVFTAYLAEHYQRHSTWRNTVERLGETHIYPPYGDKPVHRLRRHDLINYIDRLSLTQPSTANNLMKAMKAFLTWCVSVNLIDAHPLAGAPLPTPYKDNKQPLSVTELCTIYTAATQLGEPWSTMIKLMILTGEAMEDIRQMQNDHIDWDYGEWFKYHRVDEAVWGVPDKLSVRLCYIAMKLLQPHRQKEGFLFASPRRKKRGLLQEERPIYFRTGILHRLQSEARVNVFESLKDIRRSVKAGIERCEVNSTNWPRAVLEALENGAAKNDPALDDIEL